jgi:hypothetical protein
VRYQKVVGIVGNGGKFPNLKLSNALKKHCLAFFGKFENLETAKSAKTAKSVKSVKTAKNG